MQNAKCKITDEEEREKTVLTKLGSMSIMKMKEVLSG